MCMVVSSLDIYCKVRDVCGLVMIEMEHLVLVISMVLNWVIAFELEQECNCVSYSLVECNHAFI